MLVIVAEIHRSHASDLDSRPEEVVSLRPSMTRLGILVLALFYTVGLNSVIADAQPAPAYGGHLRIAQSAEPPLLDPSSTTATATTSIVHHNVLEGLVKVDSAGTLVPGLAHSWTISDDALEYVFFLREGVSFHDGQSFTSADVKAKFERALRPDSGHTNAHYYEAIAAIETPDDHTVVFRMHSPDAEFLYNLARPDSVIFPKDAGTDMHVQPIGTGPFRVKSWIRGSHITLERFEDYYDSSLPYVDEVTFRFIYGSQCPSGRPVGRRCGRGRRSDDGGTSVAS